MIPFAFRYPCSLRVKRSNAKAACCCTESISRIARPCRSLGTKCQLKRSAESKGKTVRFRCSGVNVFKKASAVCASERLLSVFLEEELLQAASVAPSNKKRKLCFNCIFTV